MEILAKLEMHWPLNPEKEKFPSITSSEYFIKNQKKNIFPLFKNIQKAIICFSPVAAQKLRNEFQGKRKKILGAVFDFYEKKNTVVLSNFGIGAPAAVVYLEYLRALGLKVIFSFGWTGAFSPNLSLGDIVFIQKAFRDEGTSYHYKPKKNLCPFIKNTNQNILKHFAAKPVVSWTTDAPYRETKQELEKWKKKGASCVEMEASALMSVGQYYHLDIFCFAVISDILTQSTWQIGFSNKYIHQNFYKNFKKIWNLSLEFLKN